MKSSTSIIKALTLSGFTLLIICFVCYRAGAFDNLSFSNNSLSENNFDVTANGMAVDTPIVQKDSLVITEREMMPSSKIMILPRKEIMPSSKSIALPRSEPGGGPVKVDKLFPPLNDTVKKATPTDTTKKPIKKTTQMSSSKSGIMYESPTPDTAKPKK